MPDADPADAVTDPAPGAPPAAPTPRRRPLAALLTVAVFLLVALLAFRLFGPRPVPPPAVIAYTPQQAADAQQHIDALSAQLSAPPPAAPPPTGIPPRPAPSRQSPTKPAPPRRPAPPSVVRLQLSQADLNTTLATNRTVRAMLTARGVQAVQVFLKPPHNVTFRAAVLYKGRKTNVQIAGALLPSPDTLARFDATQAQVGTLPLPPRVVTVQAQRLAAQLLGRLRGRLPITVRTIDVVGDHLVITGLRRPAPATPPGAAGFRRSASPARR